jgi:REP element-mobilizing transposase RayT
MFESGIDPRFFLSRLAWRRRSGDIEIHSFCIMPNHFHVLLRSLTGKLSAVLQWIQSEYARRFNWSRERDGHLFRGRFHSRIVESAAHWENIVRYIDHNPVSGGLAERAEEFQFGSAWHYARPSGPPWLTRTIVEATVRYAGVPYASVFACRNPELVPRVVESRLGADVSKEPLDGLLRAAPAGVRAWLEERARNADRIPCGPVLADPATTLRILDNLREQDPCWSTAAGRQRVSVWPILAAGLLRSACGLSFEEMALRLGCSHSTARRWTGIFTAGLADDRRLADQSSLVLHRALAEDLPRPIAAARLVETLRRPPA